MKKVLSLLALGLLPIGLIIAYASLSNPYQSVNIMFCTGIITILGSSYWQRKNEVKLIWKLMLLSVPTFLVFALALVPNLPSAWFTLPAIILVSYLSLKGTEQKGLMMALSAVGLSCILSAVILPDSIYFQNSSITNETVSSFEIDNLSSPGKINNESIKGKVNVISFFGSWCYPCILETKALKELKEELQEYHQEINFIMVNTAYSRDTPEKAKKFHNKHAPDFMLGFDKNSNLFHQFSEGSHPALVVIGKDGYLRYKQIGFEPKEEMGTGLKPIIERLLN